MIDPYAGLGLFQHSYAFDVDPTTETFLNRRVLAHIDAGVPDGLQVDVNGNVYTACADGVQVRKVQLYPS